MLGTKDVLRFCKAWLHTHPLTKPIPTHRPTREHNCFASFNCKFPMVVTQTRFNSLKWIENGIASQEDCNFLRSKFLDWIFGFDAFDSDRVRLITHSVKIWCPVTSNGNRSKNLFNQIAYEEWPHTPGFLLYKLLAQKKLHPIWSSQPEGRIRLHKSFHRMHQYCMSTCMLNGVSLADASVHCTMEKRWAMCKFADKVSEICIAIIEFSSFVDWISLPGPSLIDRITLRDTSCLIKATPVWVSVACSLRYFRVNITHIRNSFRISQTNYDHKFHSHIFPGNFGYRWYRCTRLPYITVD